MYATILVPLDGSNLAECVFPHLENLAKGCQVKKVKLVRVVEPFNQPAAGEYMLGPEEIDRINSRIASDAQSYIGKLLNEVKYEGVGMEGEVIHGRVAETLAAYATEHGADLILIATHGRSGVSRWVWGSVAERILRSSCVPVLMVRAPGCVPGV